MAWWEALLDSIGLLGLLALGALAFLFARRRWLSRDGGTFEMSVRMRPPAQGNAAATARGWTLGLGRYSEDRLEWFRIFSFSPRPKQVFGRSLEVRTRRTPQGAEAFSLYGGHVVVAVQIEPHRTIEMAMSPGALTGFLAWTEAGPPGRDPALG